MFRALKRLRRTWTLLPAKDRNGCASLSQSPTCTFIWWFGATEFIRAKTSAFWRGGGQRLCYKPSFLLSNYYNERANAFGRRGR